MNNDKNFIVRKVAVLGAGVMGAQIAAHFVNANVPVILFDLPAPEGNANGMVIKAIHGLQTLEPSPLALQDRLFQIDAANYDDLLELQTCDLIVEAVAERRDVKLTLYEKIARYIHEDAVLASNTSGLSVNALAAGLPEALRSRFCGVHFFNPPRYMQLVELIPCHATPSELLDKLERFLVTTLGKGVVRALDTPNFIANRVGVFAMLAAMHHTERLGLGFDEVDALTGSAIGRPKSATYRTADVVGLDTMAHVIKTMQDSLPNDPWHAYYRSPDWLIALIEKGALGQKSKGGIYRKEGKEIRVLDVQSQAYRLAKTEIEPELASILKLKNPAEKFEKLQHQAHSSVQAQFLWSVLRDTFHYCAYHLADIAHSARDVDLAMRWGFGWSQGPFETWQAAGWQTLAQAITADIESGKTMSSAPLPAWVGGGRCAVHSPRGSYSAREDGEIPRSSLPVYLRQRHAERLVGEEYDNGITDFENEAIRLWYSADQSDIAIVSFKSKMNTLGPDVVDSLIEAVARAERSYKGMVIWQPRGPFSLGANLSMLLNTVQAGDYALIEQTIVQFQMMTKALRYAQIPVVAAVSGMALGGGCEVMMHCARTVAALESTMGLVETGVGLIPAGGGCKELVIRATKFAALAANKDPFSFLQQSFQTVAQAFSSKSALEARALGLLRESDLIICNANEVLFVAQQTARALHAAGYRPPFPLRGIKVAGRDGIATLEKMRRAMREAGTLSEHDYRVSKALASALCGGDVAAGTMVTKDWLLAVERHEFLELLKTEKTQQRIQYTLATGKLLRN